MSRSTVRSAALWRTREDRNGLPTTGSRKSAIQGSPYRRFMARPTKCEFVGGEVEKIAATFFARRILAAARVAGTAHSIPISAGRKNLRSAISTAPGRVYLFGYSVGAGTQD